VVGDFTLLNGALIMAEEKSRSALIVLFHGTSGSPIPIFTRSNRHND
jgi:hypothetical protein